MKFDKEHMSYVYEHISYFKPLNCIYQSAKEPRAISIEKYQLPLLIQGIEQQIIGYLETGILNHSSNKGYYYENSWHMRYMGLGMYKEGQYLGYMILGPYLNRCFQNHEIQAMLKEKNIEEGVGEELIACFSQLPRLDVLGEKMILDIAYTLLQVGDLGVSEVECYKPEKEEQIKEAVIERYQSNRMLFGNHYYSERKLLHYISQGNEKRALMLIQEINPYFPDEIHTKSLRHFKNAIIPLNTLMRKSIENQNIDSYILHKVTTKFLVEIEQSTSVLEIRKLIDEMTKTYCSLVNQAVNVGYSSTVVNTIRYIKFNMEKELILKDIAQHVYVHPNYLSRKFKQETGRTVFEYINQVRIEEAAYLLKNTALSIEEIAYAVGYNDKNYFTKVFKKNKKQIPSDFRDT